MEPYISLITLGVSDLARSTAFYKQGLGLPAKEDFEGVTFLNLKGTWLALYPREALADRIGAYAARYAAKNVVAVNLADECEVHLSYSIGLARPVSIQVETFGTGKLPDDQITMMLEKHFDFRLVGIIKQFNLRHLPKLTKGGFYRQLAAYGHVGRTDIKLPWEETDKVTVF